MAPKVRIGPNESPTVEVINDNELRAMYAGGGGIGPQDVVVTTHRGSATAVGGFTAIAPPPPPPTIAAVEPNSGPGGTWVTIRGSGFAEP